MGALGGKTIIKPSRGCVWLPSLYNTVRERSELIADVPPDQQNEIDKSQQLAIRRGRISLEILKRPSDDKTKFDLFQRLNAGGTQANAQELRNCIMIMVNGTYFRAVKLAAEQQPFQRVTATDDQIDRQRHLELAVRFLVHTLIPYNGKLDVEEYIDDDILNSSDRRFSRVNEDLVNTKANLNSYVFADICLVCGIPIESLADKATFIDILLLKRRNEIAHGEETFVALQDLDEITNETVALMRGFGDLLENRVYLKEYRATAA